MAHCSFVRATQAAKACHFLHLSTTRPIAKFLSNEKQPYPQSHFDRIRLIPSQISAPQSHSADTRRKSSATANQQEITYWMKASPHTLTMWENALLAVHGPRFRDKLSGSDQEMLEKVQARRELIIAKRRELLGEEGYDKYLKRREKHIEQRGSTIIAEQQSKTRIEREENEREDNIAFVRGRSSKDRLARFISDEELLSEAKLFVDDLLFFLQRIQTGYSTIVRLVQSDFGPQEKTKQHRQIINQHRKTLLKSRRNFIENLRKKLEAMTKGERNPASMKAALRQAQQESLARQGFSLTEGQLEDFHGRSRGPQTEAGEKAVEDGTAREVAASWVEEPQ